MASPFIGIRTQPAFGFYYSLYYSTFIDLSQVESLSMPQIGHFFVFFARFVVRFLSKQKPARRNSRASALADPPLGRRPTKGNASGCGDLRLLIAYGALSSYYFFVRLSNQKYPAMPGYFCMEA
jgi:hypothetical protein